MDLDIVSSLELIDPIVEPGLLLNLSVNTPLVFVIVSLAIHGRVETTVSEIGMPFSSRTIPVILRGPVGLTSPKNVHSGACWSIHRQALTIFGRRGQCQSKQLKKHRWQDDKHLKLIILEDLEVDKEYEIILGHGFRSKKDVPLDFSL